MPESIKTEHNRGSSQREVWAGLVVVILSVFFLLLLLKIELEKDHPLPEPEGLRVVSGGNGVEVWWPGWAPSGVKEAGFISPPAGPTNLKTTQGGQVQVRPWSSAYLSLQAEGPNKDHWSDYLGVCACVSVGLSDK